MRGGDRYARKHDEDWPPPGDGVRLRQRRGKPQLRREDRRLRRLLGPRSVGEGTPPAGEFITVSAGASHNCGVKTDGSVACWGQDLFGEGTPPAGEFITVSAGGPHTCGVKTDGSAACWGDDTLGQATPPAGEFISVSAGGGQHLRGEDRRLGGLLGR